MNREDVISLARQALEKQGFLIQPEANFTELVPAELYNAHLTAMKVSGPRWVVSFPLQKPNELREVVIVSVDDNTGEVSEGCAS